MRLLLCSNRLTYVFACLSSVKIIGKGSGNWLWPAGHDNLDCIMSVGFGELQLIALYEAPKKTSKVISLINGEIIMLDCTD
jgi:hypothetical protein